MQIKNTKTLLSLMMAITIFIFSCQKDNTTTELSTGNAIVNVKMSGIGSVDGSKSVKASIGGSSAATAAVQRVTVPYGEDLVIRATLTEVKASQRTALRASAAKAATTSTDAGEIVAFNGDYTIRAYKKTDANNETLVQTVNCGNGKSNQFELEPGNYKFVVSAYGNPVATGEDKDPLSQVIEQTVSAGNNTLDVILKHKLTEVTVKFDAGSGRTINAISNSTVKPNYNYTFDEATGNVTFGTELAAKGFTFPTQAPAQIWTSSPVMIAVDNSNGAGEVKLANVTINNKPGNVSLPGLTLRKGFQYVLEMDLGAKVGFEIGGEIWSPGNLEYDPSTGEYGFGKVNTIGDYWYANYLKPKVLPYTNNPVANNPAGINGSAGDPCSLVAPAGFWRLPTTEDVASLLNAKKYIGRHDGASGAMGMFFGTDVAPGTEADKYAFFPFNGYYTSWSDVSENEAKGAYLLRNIDGVFKRLWLSGNAGSSSTGGASATVQDDNQATWAQQIRCVKN